MAASFARAHPAAVSSPAANRPARRVGSALGQAGIARRALDFDDLEAGALALLCDHPAASARWQAEVRALLVDEFQDTNARQRDLLALLNGDAGKRFIVGDGKQSIYRFRGADVTVFRATQREIAAQGQGYLLETSYRAHRDLITVLNALLQPVLGVDEDPARPYVEPFAALTHHRATPPAGLTPPFVELHLGVGSKAGGALDKAAEALATRLAALVEDGRVQLESRDPDTGQVQTRPLDYGDIAILCRASTSFAPYENALERAGIPFLTVAGRGFYERPEVRDVLNALTILADPTDDLALAGLLRSPACGLSDLALYRLTEERADQEAPSLWEVLNGASLDFLADEAPCATEAVALIRRLHAQAGRVTVAALLKDFLDATHYRAALLRAGQARGAGNLAKLLTDAHTSGIVSVSEFLDYVTQLRDAGTREGEAHTLSVGAVQLMTVHAAKGLEFPVVVIGDAGKAVRSGRGAMVDATLGVVPPLKTTGEDEVPAATSLAYRLAQQAAADQEVAESDRLLYVAATRAQDMLILSGTASARKDGLGLGGWLERLDNALHLSASAPACDPEGEAIQHVALSAEAQPASCFLYEGNAEIAAPGVSAAPSATAALPENLPLLDSLIPPSATTDDDTEAEHRDPPRRVWRVVPEKARPTAPAWVVGTLVHGALEQWLFPDSVVFARWAEAEARGRGITDAAELRNAVQRAARMLTRFQATDLYAAMNGATQRLHEVPYTLAMPDGALELGTLDALFCDDGQWTLVEFKTDHVADPVALTALLATTDYRAQVTRYLDAAERLLGVRPCPALCFLNVGGMVRVVKERLHNPIALHR
ncbi:MAG: UvrD-helicase domain-containing protein [Anaerolineae bacterium]